MGWKLWLCEVQICEKVTARRSHLFLQNSSIFQIYKKEAISLTASTLSFPDWGCFILEFGILKSTVSQELAGLSSPEAWD